MVSKLTVEARLAAVAVGQHGVFTRAHAITAGFSATQIERRVRAGAWVRVVPRVFRHATTPRRIAVGKRHLGSLGDEAPYGGFPDTRCPAGHCRDHSIHTVVDPRVQLK